MLSAFELTVSGVPVIWIILVLLAVTLPFIRRVPEGSVYVIKNVKHHLNHGIRCVWKPGVHMLIPFTDYVAKVVTQAEQTMQCEAVCTPAHNSEKLHINLEIRYRISNVEKYADTVTQPEEELKMLTKSALRALLEDSSRNDGEISYPVIAEKLTEAVGQAAALWGFRVLGITVASIV